MNKVPQRFAKRLWTPHHTHAFTICCHKVLIRQLCGMPKMLHDYFPVGSNTTVLQCTKQEGMVQWSEQRSDLKSNQHLWDELEQYTPSLLTLTSVQEFTNVQCPHPRSKNLVDSGFANITLVFGATVYIYFGSLNSLNLSISRYDAILQEEGYGYRK